MKFKKMSTIPLVVLLLFSIAIILYQQYELNKYKYAIAKVSEGYLMSMTGRVQELVIVYKTIEDVLKEKEINHTQIDIIKMNIVTIGKQYGNLFTLYQSLNHNLKGSNLFVNILNKTGNELEVLKVSVEGTIRLEENQLEYLSSLNEMLISVEEILKRYEGEEIVKRIEQLSTNYDELERRNLLERR